MGLTQIDLNKVFPMKLLELEVSYSVESYDEKNCRKFNDDEKRILSKL